jgi:hypothetical protein
LCTPKRQFPAALPFKNLPDHCGDGMTKELDGCNHWVIEDLEEELEVLAEEVIEGNKELLLELLPVQDISEVNLGQIERVLFSDVEPKTTTDFKKQLTLYIVYLLLKIDKAKKNLRNAESDHLHHIYLLAEFRARLSIATYDLKNFDSETDWRHEIKSRLAMTKRWVDRRKQYEEALSIADKLWSEGESFLRHEMANYLKTEVFPNLSYETLQEKLTPIAEKYGKMWDAKKSRKRKIEENKAAKK